MNLKYTIMNIRIWMLAACLLLVAACNKEDFTDAVVGGQPVTAKLVVAVPESKKVDVSRAGSSHSEIASLDIFVYDQTTGAFESTTKATLGTGTLNGTTREYPVSFETTTGAKTLLAIANGDILSEWDIDMAELRAAKHSLADMKKQLVALQQTLINAQQLPGFAGLHMLLIGQQNVTVNNAGNIEGDNLPLHRAAVEVTFEIRNGSALDSDGSGTVVMDFNPSTYQLFNVPKGTQIGENILNTDEIGYYDTGALVAPPKNEGMYSFTFYMPENIQALGTNNDYNGREAWTNAKEDAATPAGDKEWEHAPQNSTFIVITGAFNTTEGGVLKQTGMVSYTIHLGDFTANPKDYSVERNYSYKYKVTVNGVKNIIAEAEKTADTYQNAAEGGVINVGEYTQDYTLDAHYEQVFLEYDITQMANDITTSIDQGDRAVQEEIGNNLRMIVETPFTQITVAPYRDEVLGEGLGEEEEMFQKDYKWVEFYPQAVNNRLMDYPGEKNANGELKAPMITGYQLTVDLGKAIFNLKKNETLTEGNFENIVISRDNDNNHYVARFTAFVDEYYYTISPATLLEVEWDEFVNTDMRRMMLAMDVQISDDQNSQSVKLYSNISQRSMQTFYDLKKAATLNGFGIEAFNETPGTENYGNPRTRGNSMGNGYHNTLLMIGGANSGTENVPSYSISGVDWSRFVHWAQNGYFSTNTSTDPVASHKIPNSQSANGAIAAYYACMSRNRDLNGNGTIEIEEVRWYMPAVHEYIRIALGSGAIASESQLYHGQKSELSSGDNYYQKNATDASMYYTSTSQADLDAIHYWTVEKGSYSDDYNQYAGYESPTAIRCIRHLPNPDGTVVTTPDPFYTLEKLSAADGGNYLLDYTGILQSDLLRQSLQEGAYNVHNEDDPINRFYKGMVVAKDYLRYGDNNTGYVQLFKLEDIITNTDEDVCANYSEKSDRSDRGKWRVPNQSELTSLSSRTDLFFPKGDTAKTDETNNIYDNYWGILCRTQFSNPNCRFGFTFRGKMLSCPQKDQNAQGGVRCVRDATDAEMAAATPAN